MPIKKENKHKYPKDWKTISNRIRFERAQGRCECSGECGLHSHPPRRCEELHNEKAKFANGKIILTVAHLNHQENDCRDENLKAMCNRCHLRYDSIHHQKNAKITRRKKLNIDELFPCA